MGVLEVINNFVSKIDGWLSFEEGKFLYETAKGISGKGVIVEIGSWKGKSTVWLAKGSQAGKKVKVYAVDPHTGADEQKIQYGNEIWTFEEFKGNIKKAGIENLVVPIVKTSEEAALGWDGEPIELLWIDGAHDYEFVKKDFDLWSKYIVEEGIIAFHDSLAPGPAKVIEQDILAANQYKFLGRINQITYVKKVKKLELSVRIYQLYLVLLYKIKRYLISIKIPSFLRDFGRRIFYILIRK